MKYGKAIFTLLFAMFLFAGGIVTDASAQSKSRNSVNRGKSRPVIVRRYIVRDPFLSYRYWGNPYYRNYWGYYNPYLEYRERRNYLQGRVRGNRSELEKHRAKYYADGIITAKEREELNDDVKDVRESVRELNDFNRRF